MKKVTPLFVFWGLFILGLIFLLSGCTTTNVCNDYGYPTRPRYQSQHYHSYPPTCIGNECTRYQTKR